MARNRQKAKERQARRKAQQSGHAGSGAGASAPQRRQGGDPIADDVLDELERESVVSPGADAGTPPPLSESERLRDGAPPQDVGTSARVLEYEQDLESSHDDPEHFDPAEDHPEDEADLAPGPRGRRGDTEGEAGEGSRLVQFLRSVIAELRRVQWPDRQALTTLTGVVLGFVVIAGAYLGLLDAVFQRLVDAII
jgi:preprotein translocase SecE subunit